MFTGCKNCKTNSKGDGSGLFLSCADFNHLQGETELEDESLLFIRIKILTAINQ